jgi:predicted transcriptional regulator
VVKKINETFQKKKLDFLMYVSHNLAFTKFDIADALGAHFMFVERVISQMFLSNLLKKGEQRSEWTLSKAGRKWVEKKISEQQHHQPA